MSKTQKPWFFSLSDQVDFHWEYNEEPHRSRRQEILKKHPEVKELYGPDHKAKYFVVLEVALQFLTAYLINDAPWWLMLIIAYVWGGTINHSLSLAIHEISHNHMFDKPFHNTLMGFFANLPIPFAYSMYVFWHF